MNPCVMSAVKITDALGIEGGVRSVTVTDNGGGFVVTRSDARIEWESPADFARLVESRRVKPWENERDANEDEYEAREMLRKAAMEWILNLWEGRGESTHLRARFILARIGFRKVMADIAGKGGPVDPPKDQPLTWVEVAEWLRRGKSDGSRESIAPSTKPGEFFVDGKFNHQTRWYTLPELTATVRGVPLPVGKGKPEQPGELTVREVLEWMRDPNHPAHSFTMYKTRDGKWDMNGRDFSSQGMTIEQLAALVRGG
jgi:hypothetical protein